MAPTKRPRERRAQADIRMTTAREPEPRVPVDEDDGYEEEVRHSTPNRAGFTSGTHPEDRPITTSAQPVKTRTQPGTHYINLTPAGQVNATRSSYRPIDEDEEYDDTWPTRQPSSALRFTRGNDVTTESRRAVQRVPQRRYTQQQAIPNNRALAPVQKPQQRVKIHLPFWTIWGLLIIGFLLCLVVTGVVYPWIGSKYNVLVYGSIPTTHISQDVGHGGTSDFTSINRNGTLHILEDVGAHPMEYKLYIGGPATAAMPCFLSFVPNSTTHRLDMLVKIGDNSVLFTNTGKTFVPPTIN